MNISNFITDNMEQILIEWERFATTFGAVADKMSPLELRDHAKQILQFIAADIRTSESAEDAKAKSLGLNTVPSKRESASEIHGKLRYSSGFTLRQLIAEYRALRASVLELWGKVFVEVSVSSTKDIMRFNAAIDQSLAEAAVAYSNKVNQTRDIFLAILGHDLRGPLAITSVAGAFLSREGIFDEEVRRMGQRVGRSAATMNVMVNDLLTFARMQLGDGIPIERSLCDVREIIQSAIEEANAAHPCSVFELHVHGSLTGSFDKPRLQQLLANLANNAAQYGTPGKSIIVKISGEKDSIFLEVRNEGPTIPEVMLPTLFDALVQLPEQLGNERPRSSLGLGLFIAKQIAIAHGGDIKVTSDEKTGTVFLVNIPRD
ncbi:ATP-binding protein [Janthinobacterium sp. LB2P70]|uniref:ATP-binding protein n=1 Tax=Janthinobacterium sp. LB2P70 TaxID=3424197 RepID=UPI003F1E901C